jgi:hypothetical protein
MALDYGGWEIVKWFSHSGHLRNVSTFLNFGNKVVGVRLGKEIVAMRVGTSNG